MVTWPVTCQKPVEATLRYCFRDKRSAKNLVEIVDKAVKGWSHAMVHSAHRIQLDPGTGGDPEVVCSDERVAKDALVISDETKDGDTAWNDSNECKSSATPGYIFIANGEPAQPFRHTLKFCGYSPGVPALNMDYAVQTMMHELGHSIGLWHEHQPPDRDTYIRYRPKRLQRYDEVIKAAEKDAWNMFYDEDEDESEDQKTRQQYLCNFGEHAEKYFPSALAYTIADRMDDKTEERLVKFLEFSDKFDYDSIMLYDSNDGAKVKGKYVLSKRDDGSRVYMGGGPSAEAKISAGDIARVAMLHDNGTPECKAAQQGGTWGPVKVTIRDTSPEVVNPPWLVKRDEL